MSKMRALCRWDNGDLEWDGFWRAWRHTDTKSLSCVSGAQPFPADGTTEVVDESEDEEPESEAGDLHKVLLPGIVGGPQDGSGSGCPTE